MQGCVTATVANSNLLAGLGGLGFMDVAKNNMYVCMYVCINIYIYTYRCIHIYIYTHMYIFI